jgi:hypothetical protein
MGVSAAVERNTLDQPKALPTARGAKLSLTFNGQIHRVYSSKLLPLQFIALVARTIAVPSEFTGENKSLTIHRL